MMPPPLPVRPLSYLRENRYGVPASRSLSGHALDTSYPSETLISVPSIEANLDVKTAESLGVILVGLRRLSVGGPIEADVDTNVEDSSEESEDTASASSPPPNQPKHLVGIDAGAVVVRALATGADSGYSLAYYEVRAGPVSADVRLPGRGGTLRAEMNVRKLRAFLARGAERIDLVRDGSRWPLRDGIATGLLDRGGVGEEQENGESLALGLIYEGRGRSDPVTPASLQLKVGPFDVSADAEVVDEVCGMVKAMSVAVALAGASLPKPRPKPKPKVNIDGGSSRSWGDGMKYDLALEGGDVTIAGRWHLSLPRMNLNRAANGGLALGSLRSALQFGPSPPGEGGEALTQLWSLPEGSRMRILLFLRGDDVSALELVLGLSDDGAYGPRDAFFRCHAVNKSLSGLARNARRRTGISRMELAMRRREGLERNSLLSELGGLDGATLKSLLSMLNNNSK
mmetsp:Transcript_32480/g.64391  ORF Transcript_32480/g.64391 Transcript_32480/m.64391 type:complete len:457 (+) Transcript_32480:1168-2538(+)